MKIDTDTSNWVVVLFPRNKQKSVYTVRLYKTTELATSIYGKASRAQYVYTTAGEMEARIKDSLLKQYLIEITEQFSKPTEQYKASMLNKQRGLTLAADSSNLLANSGDRKAMVKGLWTLCHIVGDVIFGVPDSPENKDKFRIRLDRMTSDEGRRIWACFPKQAKVFAEALIEEGEQVLDEVELHDMARNLVACGKLKTKQDPALIWDYYASRFAKHSFVYYPGLRNKLEDHEENMAQV